MNCDSWDDLVSSMQPFDADEIILESQSKYHFDVMEVKCKLPLLLNLFYVDPSETKVDGLEVGDISIFSLEKGTEQELTFKIGKDAIYVYSLNILKGNNQNPNIEIVYDGEETIQINENGVYPKYSLVQFKKLLVKNKDNSGSTSTRIIFKFGLAIEIEFQSIQNGIYSNENDKNRTVNLFGYIHDNTLSKLNYTGVEFTVSTREDNVKFCYSTNLGTYIYPSMQNCFRVGKSNPYTITTLNPLVMFRNYYSEEKMKYYVGFRTVELNQNITITPRQIKYNTKERNLENVSNKITLPMQGKLSTILTAPKNNEPYIFTHIHVCTKGKALSYEFLNAYNSTNLGFNGEIQPNSKNHFKSVDNTKLDTELTLECKTGKADIYVKHVGISERYQPLINDIKIAFNKETRVLNWTQPIENEEFKYTVYFDKIKTLAKFGFTLCNVAEEEKLASFSEIVTTDSNNPSLVVPDYGKEYKEFDTIIVAEQVNKGQITILSAVYDSNGHSSDDKDGGDSDDSSSTTSTNTGLIVLIIILSLVIIAGAIFAFIIYRKYKSEGEVSKKNKETSMALIKSTKNDKLVESQAAETNQIDP